MYKYLQNWSKNWLLLWMWKKYWRKKKSQKLMNLPTLCTACAICPKEMLQLVPDRIDKDPPYRYEALCPLCLDEFLGVFPRLFETLMHREIIGQMRPSIRRRSTQRARRNGHSRQDTCDFWLEFDLKGFNGFCARHHGQRLNVPRNSLNLSWLRPKHPSAWRWMWWWRYSWWWQEWMALYCRHIRRYPVDSICEDATSTRQDHTTLCTAPLNKLEFLPGNPMLTHLPRDSIRVTHSWVRLMRYRQTASSCPPKATGWTYAR